jgi:hypothetical protein
VSELAVELRRVRAEIYVEEAVGLLGRIFVEAQQGFHGVGRGDFLEDGLELLLASEASDTVKLRLRADHRGNRGKLLRGNPAGDVLVAAAREQGVQHVLPLIMEN